jgi:D-alanyl-lipoteichoic acid acyltransferase DltB (MBOAT superfamily)
LPVLVSNNNRKNLDSVAKGKYFPTIKEFSSMFITFALTLLGSIFFRAESLQHAFQYISEIMSYSLFDMPHFMGIRKAGMVSILIVFFLLIE